MKTPLPALTMLLLFLLAALHPLAAPTLEMSGEPISEVTGRSTACSGSVCINEVIPNPNGADTGVYPTGSGLSCTTAAAWTLI